MSGFDRSRGLVLCERNERHKGDPVNSDEQGRDKEEEGEGLRVVRNTLGRVLFQNMLL